MIWLLLRRSSHPTSIVSSKHPCLRLLVLHLPLLLNRSEVMLILPALCMKTAAGKRSFAIIVKEKVTKRRNVERNPAMLSNAKGPGQIQLEHKSLQWMSLVWVIVRRKRKMLLDGNDSWCFLSDKMYRPSWIPQVISILFEKTLDHLCLRPLFLARAATQAGGILLKTYLVFHEPLQIKDSFGAHLDAWDLLTSANIEVSLILGLPWLHHHNPILNFDPITIHWWDSSSTVTDSIEEPLDLGSLTQIPADFQVMEVQLDMLDESLEEPSIPRVNRDLADVFSPSNANFLLPHRDEDHAIELEPGKTPPFGPLYNLSEY